MRSNPLIKLGPDFYVRASEVDKIQVIPSCSVVSVSLTGWVSSFDTECRTPRHARRVAARLARRVNQ